jgi:hypothetical protein
VVQTIVCDEKLRTPLVGKKQLADMKFSSISSTVTGDGEMFYAYEPLQVGMNAPDQKDLIVLTRYYKERSPNVALPIAIPPLPSFRTEVNRVKLGCRENKMSLVDKGESYDDSNNLVALVLYDQSQKEQKEFQDNSPFAMLQRIVCNKEQGGK